MQEIIRHHREKLNNYPMKEYTVKSILWQLLNGLNYLHRYLKFVNKETLQVFTREFFNARCWTLMSSDLEAIWLIHGIHCVGRPNGAVSG